MYIDLTHAFTKDMPVFPGDPLPELLQIAKIDKDGFVDHQIKTSMHIGTHMDAPAHIVEGGKYLSEYNVEKFFGRGVIIDARGKKSAEVNLLEGIQIKKSDIILVCFGWATEFEKEEYYFNYPEISQGFAERLGELGASIIGMDTPSPDRAPYKVHNILFGKDILILENLVNLESLLHYPKFEIIALPVKFKTDSAPCRVVAKIN